MPAAAAYHESERCGRGGVVAGDAGAAGATDATPALDGAADAAAADTRAGAALVSTSATSRPRRRLNCRLPVRLR